MAVEVILNNEESCDVEADKGKTAIFILLMLKK